MFGCWESFRKESREIELKVWSCLGELRISGVEVEIFSFGLLFLLMWNSCENVCWMGNHVWLIRKLGWKRGRGRKFGVLSWQEGEVVVFRNGFSSCLVAEKVVEKKVEEIELKLWSCFGELRVSGVWSSFRYYW